MTAIRSAGGTVKIDSSPGTGTVIALELIRVSAPTWFLDTLDLRGYEQAVVVDDDQSIHGIWQDRFQVALADIKTSFSVVHLQNDRQLYDHTRTVACQTFYLVDLDLHGSQEDGLRLIEALKLQKSSALVTSHYEDRDVIARCQMLGVSVIPKPSASIVPVILN